MATSSVSYNKPVLPRVSDTSDLASNRANVYSGKGLDFDGVNDKIDSDFSFVGTQATISFYLSWDSYGTNNVEFILEGNANSNFMIHLGGGSGTNGIRFVMNSSVGQNLDVTNGVQPGLNHYVLTTDNSTASLYINGKLFNSQSKVLGQANTPYLGIGYRRNSPSYYLNGRLSGLKIFDQALTATQVAELYNNPEQILPTGVSAVNLKLWLPMMEGAGSYVYNGAAGATGTELVSNGGFDEVCQKWGLSDVATIAITGGKAVWTNPASGGAFADQYISATTGKTYRVTFDYSASDGGYVYIGNQYVSIPSGSGTYTADIAYTSGSARVRLAYGSSSALTASIDNVSVKEVVPQATGTISGATWVSGLPEPLPQTALMDWNKGANLLKNSEAINESNWVKLDTTVGENSIAAPNGFPSADKIIETTANSYHLFGEYPISVTANVPYKASCYFKAGTALYGTILINSVIPSEWATIVFDLTTGQITKQQAGSGGTINDATISSVGDGWYLVSIVATINNSSLYPYFGISNSSLPSIGTYGVITYTGNTNNYLYCWGVSFQREYDGYTYVSTAATAQTSPVLIPKGITTGKDIFGNSIAVPRSSGAFNFDGASWAEVQDNASFDFGSGSWSIECWFYWNGSSTGKGIASRWYSASRAMLIYTNGTHVRLFNGISSGAGDSDLASSTISNGWNHIVGTYNANDAKLRIYLNGSLDATGSAISNAYNSGSQPFEIGRYNAISAGAYDKGISNVRVYGFALTAEQVADNYNQKTTTFGGSTTISELQAYINRTNAAGATVEAHPSLLNTLTELDSK